MNHKSKLSDKITEKKDWKIWQVILITIFVFAGLILLGWGIFVGLAMIICLCFGIKVSLPVITGIYVLVLLIKFLFDSGKK